MVGDPGMVGDSDRGARRQWPVSFLAVILAAILAAILAPIDSVTKATLAKFHSWHQSQR